MSPKIYAILFALLTAVFWGLYGPALLASRATGVKDDVFKPFVMIGIAYLIIGVVGGLIGNAVVNASFSFHPTTIKFGFIAGALGAAGAFTLTLAIYTGGSPKVASLVMPIVFGGATIVAVFFTLISKGELTHAHPMQFIGTLAIVVGVVLVQAYASHGPAKPSGAPKPSGALEAMTGAEEAEGNPAPTEAPPTASK